MTKNFCDRCGKDISTEESGIKIQAGSFSATLYKPSYATSMRVDIRQDICWSCVLFQLKEYVEEQ